MKRLIAKWKMLLPLFLVATGVAFIALGSAADLIGAGAQGGFGRTQVAAVVVGLTIALGGGVLATPPGRRYLAALSGTDAQSAGPLSIAVWFGFLAGWGETMWFVYRYARNYHIQMGPDFLWMVPLANLMLFAVVGLILSALRRLWPKSVSLWVVAFTCAFLVFLNLLLLFERLHDWAAVALALGLAVQTARVAARHPQGFHRVVRYTLGWPVILRLGRLQGSSPGDPDVDSGSRLSRREFLIGAGSTVAAMAIGVRGGAGWSRLGLLPRSRIYRGTCPMCC